MEGQQLQEELDIKAYWRILRRRWRLIGLVAGLIFLAGAIYTFAQTPMYQGEATLLVEDQKGAKAGILSELSNLSAGSSPVETEMEILKSRTLAEQVVRQLSLDAPLIDAPFGTRLSLTEYRSERFLPDDQPIFTVEFQKDGKYEATAQNGEKLGSGVLGQPFNGKGVSWTLDYVGVAPKIRFAKIPFNKAVITLRERTAVGEASKKTNVIRVSVEHADPALARDIANTLAGAYLAQNLVQKGQEATQTLEFIETQLDTIRGNLESGELELDQLKSAKGIFILSQTAQKLIGQITQLEITKAELELQYRQITQLSDNLQSAGRTEAPYILGAVSLPDPLVTGMISQLSSKLVELRGLREELTEDNPRITLLKSQIDELKLKIRAGVANGKSALSNRLATVINIIGNYEAQLNKLPQAERELAALTRRSEVDAELYTFLLKKHEEARIARAGIVGNVRVLDPSLSPDKPVSPRKKRNLAMALLAGLLFGITLALWLEFTDDSIKSIEDVERDLGLNSYGVIPFVEHEDNKPVDLSKLDPRDPVQEAFRSLRTNINYSQFNDSETPTKTILCVGALPGVGKTTITFNLAMTLAQGGNQVLLVDCDLRRPQLHHYFGLPLEPGITNALGTAGAAWGNFVNAPAGIENLSVLTSGPLPPNPVEFLASPRFHTFTQEAAAAYDYVLFDGPPIVAFTDAALLASKVDAVFMVVHLGRSSLPLTRRALELLYNVQAKVRGAILNKATAAGHGDQYYDYESYGYHHYETATKRKARPWVRLWEKILG
jgi:tyrosine-protein kinase Etk/Wzc